MSWPGYLTLAVVALLAGNALWALLATRQIRGRSVASLTGLFPDLDAVRGKAAIYCYSAHCGSCRRLTPIIADLRCNHPNLFMLDVGAHPAEARDIGVSATPTVLLLDDGVVLKAVLGAQGLGSLKVFLGIH